IVYSIIEDVRAVDDIKHPAVREGLKFLRVGDGVEIHHDGDLPARAGLGSSSSFMVGILHALHALRGEMRSRLQLAKEAIHVERDLIGEQVGSQDQVTAAFGGFNLIRFAPGEHITLQPVTLAPERLQQLERRLLLYFTGFSRNASEIAQEQIRNTPSKEKELHALCALVDQAMTILSGNDDLSDFGRLLHEGWKIKRSLSARISNTCLDEIYAKARSAGALGGKLLGAGGGGFMLFFVPPEKQTHFRQQMAPLLHVPFEFETLGTQIIFYEPAAAVKVS
ncbi:MAG: kinase, partial [Lentisphaerae bacterium]|nr:kinase [Lentisphaerota bacterium]